MCRGEVVRGVEEHEYPDGTDDQGHRRGEAIQSQIEREVEPADPRDARRGENPSVDDIFGTATPASDRRGTGKGTDDETAASEAVAEGDEEDADQGVDPAMIAITPTTCSAEHRRKEGAAHDHGYRTVSKYTKTSS